MSRRVPALAAAALVALSAVAGAGCERRSESAGPAQGEPAATIVATADHGAEVLLDERVVPGRNVMDALRSVTPVETAYGGGFVKSMLGRSSSPSPPRDWFFYVNGFESAVGARSSGLADGDVAWWDHRGWQGMQSVRAVVGSWPEPFLNGAGGTGGRPEVSADAPLAGALRAAGARVAGGDRAFRARVGTEASLSARDAAWRAIGGDPGGKALPGGIADGRVVLMPAAGGDPAPVAGARAVALLVPAGTRPADGALLAVAGLDARAAQQAAASIARDPGMLSLRYALAFDGSGTPIRAAGRSGP
jgi:hypothetical protein